MRKLYQFFKSVKLAVVLLIFITATSVLATLVPQGRELDFYYDSYPPFLTSIILNTQFNDFFRSFLFIFAMILFFVNLSVCTVDRLVREFKGKRKKRFGPDMIHVGLLVLIVGSLVTFLGRQEGFMYMAPGDEIKLPGDYVVQLETFDFFTYDDGRPKDWISTVDVYQGDERIIDSFPIEVNKPLNVGRIDVFQTSYAEESRVVLRDRSGRTVQLGESRPLESPDAAYILVGLGNDPHGSKDTAAYIEKWQRRERTDAFTVVSGDNFAGFTVVDLGMVNVTGLQAVIDPGFLPALIGLILAGLGLAITYLQKIGDKEK